MFEILPRVPQNKWRLGTQWIPLQDLERSLPPRRHRLHTRWCRWHCGPCTPPSPTWCAARVSRCLRPWRADKHKQPHQSHGFPQASAGTHTHTHTHSLSMRQEFESTHVYVSQHSYLWQRLFQSFRQSKGHLSSSWWTFQSVGQSERHLQWNSVITYPQGKWKRYEVTKVSSIQNAIFFTGRTGSTCSHVRSSTEDAFSVLNVVHYSLFVRWNHLSGHRELENVPEFEIETELFDDMLMIWKKWTKERAKSALGGKIGTKYPILCLVLYVLSEKNEHVFRLAMFVIDGENVITECTY